MIRLFTGGGLTVQKDSGGDSAIGLAHVKRNALLAYLAVERAGGPHSRDTLLALFRNLSTTMGHSTGLIREQCPVW